MKQLQDSVGIGRRDLRKQFVQERQGHLVIVSETELHFRRDKILVSLPLTLPDCMVQIGDVHRPGQRAIPVKSILKGGRGAGRDSVFRYIGPLGIGKADPHPVIKFFRKRLCPSGYSCAHIIGEDAVLHQIFADVGGIVCIDIFQNTVV